MESQLIELTIEDMSVEGQGIGKIDSGMVVFVKGGLTGDRVRAQLTKVKKNFAFAKAMEILEKSPLRNEEFDCPYYEQGCGGCPLGPLEYDAQLKIKEKQVRDRLERIGGIEFHAGPSGCVPEDVQANAATDAKRPRLNPIIGMDEGDNDGQGPWRYRNKAIFPVSTGGIITRKGGIVENLGPPAVGFYRAKSHEVVDCGDCYLQSMAAMAAADALRRFMVEDNITGYDPKWDKGLMKSLMVKTAFATGEVMVVLRINGKGIPGVEKLIGMMDEAIADVDCSLESVVLDMNKGGDRTGDRAEGRYKTIAGKQTITDRLGGLSFEISPASFYQVNPVQMKRLYDVVRQYAVQTVTDHDRDGRRPGDGERPVILDLYCGIGSIGLYCADLAEMVIGIESVKDATIDANRNAVINGIVNARFICGKAEEVLPAAVAADDKQGDELHSRIRSADIAILDPPRAGCRKELLDAIAFAEIPRIIYVSCDPATLARDVKTLGELGYELVEATPVDLFPSTTHVETVTLLSRTK